MLRKLFVVLIVLFAIALSTAGVMFTAKNNSDWLPRLLMIVNFFQAMIPVLGAGALINYLWKSCSCCHKEN